MLSYQKILIVTLALLQNASINAFTIQKNSRSISFGGIGIQSQLFSETSGGPSPAGPEPENFREAEVLGLRLMQEGQHEGALKVFQKGLKLPGSRTDIIRTKNISGPSPVGGSSGGTEGKVVQFLDEFELQAAHYNIACACASLNKIGDSCGSLEQAFKYGFDNYATVRADPDLSSVHGTPEFDNLMERFDSKKKLFGLF